LFPASLHTDRRLLFDWNRRQPVEAVFDDAVHDPIKLFTNSLRDRTGHAAADGDLVHGANRRDLRRGSAEEQLVGNVQHFARDDLLDERNAELVCEVHHRVAGDTRQNAVAQRWRADALLMHNEDILTRTFADIAVHVEGDALSVAVDDGLHLNELRVHVVGAGLGDGWQGVRSQTRPRGNANIHAVVGIGIAEVLAPLVIGDVNLGRRIEGVDPDLAIAAQHDRPDVTRGNFIGADQLHRRLAQFVEGIVQLDAIDLA